MKERKKIVMTYLEKYCEEHGISPEECSFRHMGCPKHHGYTANKNCQGKVREIRPQPKEQG